MRVQSRSAQLEHLRLQGWQILRFKTCSLVIASKELASKIHVKAWSGKADKTLWYYAFRSLAIAEENVRAAAEKLAAAEGRREEKRKEAAAKRASLKASDFWTAGDVIYDSWGYDQTNIDWYQVTEVLPRSIRIQRIASITSDHGGPCGGKSAPRRNEFCGKPMLKPIDDYGNIRSQHGSMTKWDGRPQYCSSYA